MPFPNLSGVVLKLAELLVQEGIYLYGTDGKIKWVNTELTRIQFFLRDAESKWKNGDSGVRNWVKEIADVGYQIEDLIDLINYKNEIRRQRKGFIGSMSRYAHLPGEIITLHKVGSKIDQIKAKLEDISKSKERYGNMGNEESGGGDDMINIERFHSPHFVDDTDVVGFDGYTSTLIGRLLNQGNRARSAISIVGMGGLGKTTLARKVFSCPIVKEAFPTLAWIAISQKNTLINLLREIAKQVMGLGKGGLGRSEGENSSCLSIEKLKEMGELELKKEIFEFLKERKYLVVLDDVWSTDAWEKIAHIFPGTYNGSKILLTTRDMAVAQHADPRSSPLELQVLGDEESWELLHKKIFSRNHEFNVPNGELEVLGQKLASRCGGLPLALVVLAGLLSRDIDFDSWSKVLGTMNWESMTNWDRCLEILALSYKDLPDFQIKSCFLYISSFPKGCVISPAKLVRLWIAEGFISGAERNTLEEIAKGYLDKLIQRSLVQVAKRSKTGERVKKICIHDMLQDWCIDEAQKSGFLKIINIQENSTPSPSTSNDNRVVVHNKQLDDRLASSLGSARTILTFGQKLDGNCGKILDHFNLLRVLDLEGSSGTWYLPEKIDELIHLRYLGVRNTMVSKIPSSIGKLFFLQTFDARGTRITKVPVSFWRIQSLMYIYLPCFSKVPTDEVTRNIRKLYMQFIRPDHSTDSGSKKDHSTNSGSKRDHSTDSGSKKDHSTKSLVLLHEIKLYPTTVLYNLLEQQNKLASLTIDLVSRLNEKAIISEKEKNEKARYYEVLYVGVQIITLLTENVELKFLKLYGTISEGYLPPGNLFPPNLVELTLKMSGLWEDPMLTLGTLPCLMLLRLGFRSYSKNILYCPAGGFPRLKHLSIEWSFISEGWNIEVGAMPILATLHINGCFYMDKVPIGLQHLVALKELRLSDIPRKIEKRVAKDGGEDWPIVKHIPSIVLHRIW